jgi:hypothetical protein
VTKKAFISQADLQRMAKLAKQHGVVVEQEVDGVIIRVRPFHGDIPEAWQAPTTLDNWPDGNVETAFDNAKGNSSGKKRPVNPLKEWYDSLGYDPDTMDRADLGRLMDEAHERWKLQIPGTKLLRRERQALARLSAHGPNVKVKADDIKCGPDTEERLLARGFIETFPQEKFPDRVGAYMLTDAGYEAGKSGK